MGVHQRYRGNGVAVGDGDGDGVGAGSVMGEHHILLLDVGSAPPRRRHGHQHQRLERSHDLQEQGIAARLRDRLVERDVMPGPSVEIVAIDGHLCRQTGDTRRIAVAAMMRGEFGGAQFERAPHIPHIGDRLGPQSVAVDPSDVRRSGRACRFRRDGRRASEIALRFRRIAHSRGNCRLTRW